MHYYYNHVKLCVNDSKQDVDEGFLLIITRKTSDLRH